MRDEITVQSIDCPLVAGKGVNGCHKSTFNAKLFMHHMSHWSETVCRAGGIGYYCVVCGELVTVYAVHHCDICIFAGAEMRTLLAPASKWAEAASLLAKKPVHSSATSISSSFQGSLQDFVLLLLVRVLDLHPWCRREQPHSRAKCRALYHTLEGERSLQLDRGH